MRCQIDGLAFDVKEAPALDWLKPYGRVFHVFDRQDSGNLCFGVEGPYGKLFIKYAGARTMNYLGRVSDAVETLRRAMPLYQPPHPALPRLMAHGRAGDGYAAIFEWLDAQCLRSNPPDPQVLSRLRRQPMTTQLRMIDSIFGLHLALEKRGIVAVDFYDGNVLIDFFSGKAYVCDIDLYRPSPAVNDRGRMPGSSRFLSPEEYALGATLDGCTNVYAMGALAFEFFGDNQDRSRENWQGPPVLYPVARQATRDKREERYVSLAAFTAAWRQAIGGVWLR